MSMIALYILAQITEQFMSLVTSRRNTNDSYVDWKNNFLTE